MNRDLNKSNYIIRPGMSCDIIVHKDLMSEDTDIRKALIYDIEENTFILSQTSPPLTSKLLGRNMEITFLTKKESGLIRLGFGAKFVEILKDYSLYSTAEIGAVVMIKHDSSDNYLNSDLRMLYRVKPDLNSGIKISINKKIVNLINFSIGGLCFNDTKDHTLKVGQVISIHIDIDGEQHEVNAKIVRKYSPANAGKYNVEYTYLQFLNPDRLLKNILSIKTLEIERRQLSRGRL